MEISQSKEGDVESAHERVLIAAVYTKIIFLLSLSACLYLFFVAHRLVVDPPQLCFDVLGQTIMVTLIVQRTVILWMRVIAAMYAAIAFLCFISLPFLILGIKYNNSCYVVTWLVINMLVCILGIVVIFTCYYHDYEKVWIVVPIPLLLFGILTWFLVRSSYESMQDEPMEPIGSAF